MTYYDIVSTFHAFTNMLRATLFILVAVITVAPFLQMIVWNAICTSRNLDQGQNTEDKRIRLVSESTENPLSVMGIFQIDDEGMCS